jgi:hypothetical protein
MDDALTEKTHHENVRKYRRELLTAPEGLQRLKLYTLIARAKIDAADYGWGKTFD